MPDLLQIYYISMDPEFFDFLNVALSISSHLTFHMAETKLGTFSII
jgi:hypothetical protein